MYAKYLVINALFNASTAEYFNWDYDIALLQLQRDVEFPARTVSLPTKKMLVSEMQGVKCRAAGKLYFCLLQSVSDIGILLESVVFVCLMYSYAHS